MSEPVNLITTELAAALAAQGFDAEPSSTESLGWVHARPLRCVEVVGDRWIESLRLAPDGHVSYRGTWHAPEPHAGVPEAGPFGQAGSGAIAPAGDPSEHVLNVSSEGTLSDPKELGALIERLRAAAQACALKPVAPATPGSEQAPFFLLEPRVVAVYQEWIEDAPAGWGTYEVVSAEGGSTLWRASIVQSDSRGDRYRYDVIRTTEGVAAEIHGQKDLVVHDWIWRFPLQERDWNEEIDGTFVSMQLYPVDGPVDVAAGRFSGCWRLSTLNENGSQVHTYHPTAGLILSEFTDVVGTPGRRELCALDRRDS